MKISKPKTEKIITLIMKNFLNAIFILLIVLILQCPLTF